MSSTCKPTLPDLDGAKLQDEQFKIFLEHAPAAMAMFDREMRYVLASRRWVLDYGLPEPFLGRSIYEVSPDIPDRWRDVHRRALAGETIKADDEPFERSDGRVQWLSWQVLPWHEKDGSVGGIVIFAQDITERKQTLLNLDNAQRRLHAVMDAAPVGIGYSKDRTCREITGNKALSTQFDFDPGENISASSPDPEGPGRRVRFFARERELKDTELPLQRAVAEGREILPQELEVHLPTGRRWHALASAAPVRSESGEIIGGVAVTMDVTERRRLVEALIEADRRKDEFLSVLAHELRNPLAPLRSSIYLLRRSSIAGSADKVLGIMERQIDHLVRLVDDLMQVSRITQGKIELQKKVLSLKEVIDQAIATCAPSVEGKGHKLTLSLCEQDLNVFGDETRLVQVFANLLNNAAKFTPPEGRIEIAATRANGDAVVSVRDNGRGISKPMLERIFDLFAQEDTPGEVRSGIGVGLSLARSLVEQHGGRLEASSEGPGRGSDFTVRLPLSPEALDVATISDPTGQQEFPKRVVLVVDDNREAADSLKALLEAVGQDAHSTYSGQEALEKIAELEPDIVFLDLVMPAVDGCETARRIRKLPGGRGIGLVALSGLGRAEDRSRSLEAGIDRHLTKPLSMQALRSCLSSFEPRDRRSANTPDPDAKKL